MKKSVIAIIFFSLFFTSASNAGICRDGYDEIEHQIQLNLAVSIYDCYGNVPCIDEAERVATFAQVLNTLVLIDCCIFYPWSC